jgi:AraC family transcriptional regulator
MLTVSRTLPPMTYPIGAYDSRCGRLFSVTSARKLVAHAHREWQFIFNVKGPPALFRVERTPMPVGEGEVLAIPPWIAHSKAADEGPWMVSLLIAWPWLREVHASGLVSSASGDAAWRVRLSKHAKRLLESICMYAFDDRRRERADFERDLAGLLRFVICRRTNRHAGGVQSMSRSSDHRIRKALTLMQADQGCRIRLGELAEEVGLSRSHFFHLFRQCVGTSPLHAVDCSRIARAVNMLSKTDKPIAEIAEELGFSTHGHFTRFFVRHLFIPPATYRAKLNVEGIVRELR